MSTKRVLALLSVLAFLSVSAVAQTETPTPPVGPIGSADAPPLIKLPTYLMAGIAYNQVAGANGFFSAITPVANQAGVFASATVDVFPVKTTDPTTGKSLFILTESARAGIHKSVMNDGKNVVLIGADVGASFASGAALTISPAGSFTVTYIRQLNAHWSIGLPIRALWVPAVGPAGKGGFNPVIQVGLIWRTAP